jgi:PAS domain S-box-containing protein
MALVNPHRQDTPGAASAAAPARELAPQEAAGLYRLIAETIPHMIWTTGADGAAEFFNERWHEYTGIDVAALEGWAWKSIVHPDDWERCLASWTRALQSGERYEIEYRLRRFDGAYRWHHGSAVPIRDAAGRPERWFGTCTDIEGEVRSALILEKMVDERTRALQETEGRFRAFMENAPAVAWIKDAAFRYSFVSVVFEKNLDKTATAMLGRDDFEIWPDIAPALRRNDEEVLARGAPLQAIEVAPGPDGVDHHWLVVKFPLADASGAMGVAGMGIDITGRMQAEELARGYAEDVRRLMHRLVAAQESERRRVADDLHDLIGQNLTALGIDLASLRQALGGAGCDPAAQARIDAMKTLVEKTIDSIRGVMTDLRPPALEEYGLAPALRWYATEFTERTGMKSSVSVTGRETRLARAAELALFRIAQEALTNAAKHSGGSRAQVCLKEDLGRIRLSVEDDGRGFDDPVGARSARRGGWGLPAMRERAEAHGGTLRIEFPGTGTRLIVEIPAGSESAAPPARPA